MARLVLGGDVMLARSVGRSLAAGEEPTLLDDELRSLFADADLSAANLECCITAGRMPATPASTPAGASGGVAADRPGSADRFCAPPQAAKAVLRMGLGCVGLANNHSLDAGWRGLAETRARLADVGVLAMGVSECPPAAGFGPGGPGVVLDVAGSRLGVLAVCDAAAIGPARAGAPGAGGAAGPAGPVVVEFGYGCPEGLLREVRRLRAAADAVVVFPHWGPNFSLEPVPALQTAASQLVDAGADLVVGHSAHVFQAAAGPVVFDLGGLVDDYPNHPLLRTDLGLVCAAELDERGLRSLELLPVVRRGGITCLAAGEDYRWARDRLQDAAAGLGGEIVDVGDTLKVTIEGRRDRPFPLGAAATGLPAAELPWWWT